MVVLHHLHHLHQKKQIHQVHKPSLSALALLLVMPSSGTPNFNRRGIMKKSILIILASIFLSYPTNLIGGDYETLHEFKSGDIISAEMMNELFDYIKNANKMITASDLIGTWSCEFYKQTGGGCGLETGGGTLSTVGTDGLYFYNTTTLVMDRHDNGTYIYTSTIPNIFNCGDSADNGTGLGNWVVKNNVLFYDVYKWGIKGNPSVEAQLGFAKLKKVSNSKLLMEMPQSYTVFAECDKQNLPPNKPSSLTSEILSSSITLTWTDSQTEAVTGYEVRRKTENTDNYTTVSTITDNTTRTYADTDVSTGGTYWYRVRAYNINGDGTPSEVEGKLEFP